jgi:hypothetical protein
MLDMQESSTMSISSLMLCNKFNWEGCTAGGSDSVG